jgi:hypothetical protein
MKNDPLTWQKYAPLYPQRQYRDIQDKQSATPNNCKALPGELSKIWFLHGPAMGARSRGSLVQPILRIATSKLIARRLAKSVNQFHKSRRLHVLLDLQNHAPKVIFVSRFNLFRAVQSFREKYSAWR